MLKPYQAFGAAVFTCVALIFVSPEPLKTYWGSLAGLLIGFQFVAAGIEGKRFACWLTGLSDIPNWDEGHAVYRWKLAAAGALAIVVFAGKIVLLFLGR